MEEKKKNSTIILEQVVQNYEEMLREKLRKMKEEKDNDPLENAYKKNRSRMRMVKKNPIK